MHTDRQTHESDRHTDTQTDSQSHGKIRQTDRHTHIPSILVRRLQMGVKAFYFLFVFTFSNMTFYAFAFLMATVCPSGFIATLMLNLGNGVFVLFSGFLLPFDAVSSIGLVAMWFCYYGVESVFQSL